MTADATSATQRLLALALLITVLAVLWVGVVLPVRSAYQTANERIDTLAHELARLRSLAADRPALESRLDRLRNRAGSDTLFLRGATAALAAAELQEHVQVIVGRAGGAVMSVNTRSMTVADGMQQVPLAVRMQITLPGLSQALFELETGAPLVFVDRVAIRSPVLAAAAGGGTVEPQLSVDLDLTAFAQSAAERKD